jgi:thiol-disulfide isomerase/thioredoxin
VKVVRRIWDLLAVMLVLAIVWKVWFAPRMFSPKAYPAPHAVYRRLNGGEFHVTSARGRMLFLDFYASWCAPCRQELPAVEAFARAHPRVEVVPVDVGEPRPAVAAFAVELHLGDVAFDPDALSRGFFGIEGFPTVVTIDPLGRVRAVWAGYNPFIASAMANAVAQLGGSSRATTSR